MAGMRFTILGCGSSPGVPRIGNDWGACDPNNPLNRRSRCSLLVEKLDAVNKTTVLVDTGPDFREQALLHNLSWADAVLYTHSHADHTHGIDDLRGFVISQRKKVDVYYDEPTGKRLMEAFSYCFKTPEGSSYPPILNGHLISPYQKLQIHGPAGSIKIQVYEQTHGDINSLGFRFGRFAYSSDISSLPQNSIDALQNLDVLVLDALRYSPHPSHFSVDEAIACSLRLKPRLTVLTHMHIDLDYEKLCHDLPANIIPAYDGMVFVTDNDLSECKLIR